MAADTTGLEKHMRNNHCLGNPGGTGEMHQHSKAQLSKCTPQFPAVGINPCPELELQPAGTLAPGLPCRLADGIEIPESSFATRRKFGFFRSAELLLLCAWKSSRGGKSWDGTKLLDVTKINNNWIFFHPKVDKSCRENSEDMSVAQPTAQGSEIFQIFLSEGAGSAPPPFSLGAGKEGGLRAELAVNPLKSFLLQLECVIMAPRTIITVN